MTGQQQTSSNNKNNPAPRQVNYPAVTWDYRLTKGPRGLGVAANRKIKKGQLVFGDSCEFLFRDVQKGDVLRLDRYDKASRKSDTQIPPTFALSRDVLTRTHGVPSILQKDKDKIKISWHLEVPGMLINHSCDPNVIDDSHDDAKGEAYAARDIQKGEELCYDYTFQYYEHGPFFETCLCGASNCRGSMMGFKALTDDQKQQVLPFASEAVKAMHAAAMGTGPPVLLEQYEPPSRKPNECNGNSPQEDEDEALRLVVPGPSHACADVHIQRRDKESNTAAGNNNINMYGLYAARDFAEGEQVYEFWTQPWPKENGKDIPIDMVFSRDLLPGDLPESTTVRVHALECGRKDRKGHFVFSGWDLFTAHSCNPNLVYNDKDEDEDDDWRGTYATRPIVKGEQLTVDMNTLLWDRTEWKGLGDGICTCGASTCRGIVKGFRFLSPQDQEELKAMDWKRGLPPHDDTTTGDKKKKKRVTPGEALVPHVRVRWRKYHASNAPDSASSSSGSSSSSSSDEE